MKAEYILDDVRLTSSFLCNNNELATAGTFIIEVELECLTYNLDFKPIVDKPKLFAGEAS